MLTSAWARGVRARGVCACVCVCVRVRVRVRVHVGGQAAVREEAPRDVRPGVPRRHLRDTAKRCAFDCFSCPYLSWPRAMSDQVPRRHRRVRTSLSARLCARASTRAPGGTCVRARVCVSVCAEWRQQARCKEEGGRGGRRAACAALLRTGEHGTCCAPSSCVIALVSVSFITHKGRRRAACAALLCLP